MTEKIHEQYEELEQELTKIEETGNSKKSKNGEEEESLEIAAKIKQKVEPTIQLLGNLLKATGKGMKMLSYLWHWVDLVKCRAVEALHVLLKTGEVKKRG